MEVLNECTCGEELNTCDCCTNFTLGQEIKMIIIEYEIQRFVVFGTSPTDHYWCPCNSFKDSLIDGDLVSGLYLAEQSIAKRRADSNIKYRLVEKRTTINKQVIG